MNLIHYIRKGYNARRARPTAAGNNNGSQRRARMLIATIWQDLADISAARNYIPPPPAALGFSPRTLNNARERERILYTYVWLAACF